MSPTATLLTVAAVHWVAMASPGPNVLLVAQTAMSRGRREALAAAAGVASGALLLSGAAALGLGLLVEGAAPLRTAIQLAGAAYLVYLGVQIWRSAGRPLVVAPAGPRRASLARDFRRGLLTNLTNPKALVFFGSVLAPTLDVGESGWVGIAAVVVIAVDALIWHSLLAVAFARPGVQRGYGRAKTTIDRAVGGLLALIGVRLAWSA
jgi:RhtB (resistance to homoserine/threonine) family protein